MTRPGLPAWPLAVLAGAAAVLIATGEALRRADAAACRFANVTSELR